MLLLKNYRNSASDIRGKIIISRFAAEVLPNRRSISVFDYRNSALCAEVNMYDSFKDQMVYGKRSHPGGTNMRSMSFHSGYELYFLLSGKKRYIVSGETVDFEAPGVIFIKPGVPHMALSVDDKPHSLAVVGFTDEFLSRYSDLLPSTILGMECAAALFLPEERLTRDFADDFDRFEKAGEKLGAAALSARLFGTLCELSMLRPARVVRPGSNADEEMLAVRVLERIDSGLADGISLKQAASEFGYSPDELTRLLKRTTGSGWREHSDEIRLRRALRMLIETELRFEDIAAKCGISGANYFSGYIKHAVGIPPSAYRARYKGSLSMFDPLPLSDIR